MYSFICILFGIIIFFIISNDIKSTKTANNEVGDANIFKNLYGIVQLKKV